MAKVLNERQKGKVKAQFEEVILAGLKKEKAYVQTLKKRYPKASNKRLTKLILRRARWGGVVSGTATGLPANPVLMFPLALAAASAMLNLEWKLACRIAALFDDHILDGPEPPWELLVPIFFSNKVGELGRVLAVKAGKTLTRQMIRKHLSKETLKAFQKFMLKRFGMKVTQGMVKKKAVPVVGAIISSGFNYAEVTIVANRTYRYMENQGLASLQ